MNTWLKESIDAGRFLQHPGEGFVYGRHAARTEPLSDLERRTYSKSITGVAINSGK